LTAGMFFSAHPVTFPNQFIHTHCTKLSHNDGLTFCLCS